MRIHSAAALLLGGAFLLSSPMLFSADASAKRAKKAKRIGSIAVTGLAAMHALRRERGKLCMADHFHYGNGSSPKSKARALAEAKRAWASFVNVEYGPAWARYSLAGSKGGNCTRSGGDYNCAISARPCRR